MANRGRGISTRGKNRGRPYNRGPRGAASNARNTSWAEQEAPSPPREPKLPAKVNNTDSTFSQPRGTSSRSSSPSKSHSNDQNELLSSSNSTVATSSSSQSPSFPPVSEPGSSGEGDNGSVGSGLAPPSGTDNSISPPSIELVLAELREIKQQVSELTEIKQQMSKLDKIESTTGSLANKLTGVMNRTSEIETEVRTNAARIREYDDIFASMNATVDKHEQSISSINATKDDFSKAKAKAVSDMNKLISIQKDQVESFHATSKKVSANIMTEVDRKIAKVQETYSSSIQDATEVVTKQVMIEVDQRMAKMSRQADFQALKDQAFNSRFNLVVVGLEEDSNKETSDILKDFFANTMKLKNIKFDAAYRIGSSPSGSSNSYARPILVHFPLLPHRNKVWRKRNTMPAESGSQKVRIYADLPKQLRDDVQALYKVAKAANASDDYQTARVRDYKLELDDQVFLPSELEMLPFDIRPSTLAAPRSETVLAFYTKYAVFSNHHPSIFYVDNQKFHSMEQFLAFRRAQLSEQQTLIQRASQAIDPVQAKYILSALREDNTQRWEEMVESVVMEGLEAKFRQNSSMRQYLCSTSPLTLGEASTNPRWGIGMLIDDKNILDLSKWSETGNLLGRSLMKLRSSLIEEDNNTMV